LSNATPMTYREEDLAARRAAQTVFGVPMVLEAGAGTGKTTVLVARVLAWCLGPGWEAAERKLAGEGGAPAPHAVAERVLERVVAITFTEAAAAEMESRIMTALAQVADAKPVLGYEAAAGAADRAAHALRARTLLAVFDRLHMQTIHAFCRRLLASHPLEAGLHPHFAVDARGTARNAAVREALEQRLRAMAEHGDADLEALLLHGVGAPELEEMLNALLAAAVPIRDFAADPLAPERVDAFLERLRVAFAALGVAMGDRMAGLRSNSTGRMVADATAATNALLARDIATRAELAALLAGLAAAWTEACSKRLGEWAAGAWNKSEGSAADDAAVAIGDAAGKLRPLLRHAISLDVELLALAHRALAPLLESASQRLHEDGAESFDALLRKTRDMLVAQPEIAARMRRDIDQLLVDEFQDTDSLQCEIVAALALGDDAGARPGLFLVGDPKQSIYGWRNADIGAYMSFVARVLAEPGAVQHRLCVNHRSVPAVLEEVARVVEPAMIFERGVQPEFQALLPCERLEATLGSGTPGLAAVEYWVSAEWDAAARTRASKTRAQQAAKREAEHLARELLRIHEQTTVPWKDVALLFRSTGDLDEYLGALRSAAIPYTVDRDRHYFRRREVVEAAALVRAVLDPNDQIAQVAVLRSAWIGVPDVAWRALWQLGFPEALRDSLEGRSVSRERFAAIVAGAAQASAGLDVPGLDAIAGWDANLLHALDVLIALRRSWLEEPVDRFIEKLRVLPLLEATEAGRYPGAFRLANLGRFFRELALSLETGDAATVLRALRQDAAAGPEAYEGRPQDADDDAVQVMTIHGAKGLDFEHVYLMQLHKESGSRRSAPLIHGRAAGRFEWSLATGATVASLASDLVVERAAAVGDAELVRTFYVASTRAKSRLVLVGCFDSQSHSGSHAGFVVDERADALRDAEVRVGAALASEAESTGVAEVEGLRVVFLGAVPEAASEASDPVAADVTDPATVRQHAAQLRADRLVAVRRQQRPFGERASGAVADADREARLAQRNRERADGARTARGDVWPPEAEVAAAVGTAIHAVLERFDWDAEPAAEWTRQRASLLESLARRVAPSRLDLARARATQVLDELAAGALWPRLRELAPHVLAREFPVLVRADASGAGAIGYVVGAIDLVYRDPADGEVVVVDFKTDRVADAAAIAARSRHHEPQANLYRRAVQETLRLPQAPRVELWFLDASHVEIVSSDRAPGEARG
jgi:ATP-dependent helicase/nuclease subunit A